MAYKIIITERAEEQLDNILYHIIYRLKNDQAALHLLDSMEKIYNRMTINPFQFAECREIYLKRREYREAVLPDMDYAVDVTNRFALMVISQIVARFSASSIFF